MIRKKTSKIDFRANLSIGGYGQKIELDENIQNFCVKASKAIDLGVSGVDIMINNEGNPVLIEINSNFGWKVQKITKVNIAEHIVDYVISRHDSAIKNDLNIYDELITQSKYLRETFKKAKGNTLKYEDRQGRQSEILIRKPIDLFNVIEQTFKIIEFSS